MSHRKGPRAYAIAAAWRLQYITAAAPAGDLQAAGKQPSTRRHLG
jgi:hypothetical protein